MGDIVVIVQAYYYYYNYFRKETFFEKHEVSLLREVDEIYRMPFWPQEFSTENQSF